MQNCSIYRKSEMKQMKNKILYIGFATFLILLTVVFTEGLSNRTHSGNGSIRINRLYYIRQNKKEM